MKTTSTLSDSLRRAFEPPASGFVGVADNLLSSCRGGHLELVWRDGVCRAKIRQSEIEETVEIPFRKSVFRAILARIANLCNDYEFDSVSPYGGEGKLSVGTDLPATFQIVFVNTPEEQTLAISDSDRIDPTLPPLRIDHLDTVRLKRCDAGPTAARIEGHSGPHSRPMA